MSKINFPKKQEQRLIPKYLLEYSEELVKNHPDPSADWGGGGGSPIEAGTGIEITGDETKTISIDDTVALKSELFSGDYDDLTNKPTIPTATSQLTNDSGFITSASLTNYVPFETVSGMKYVNTGNYYSQGYEPGFVNTNMLTQTKNTFKLPIDKSGTIALTSDIPTVPTKTSDLTNDSGFITSAALTSYVTTTQLNDALDDYALKTDLPENVSDLNNDAGYITGITSGMITTALGYTPGTSNFSGNYNDLTNKPDLSIYETKAEAFSGDYNDLTNKPTIPTKTSDLTNDSGYITGVTWNDVTGKPTFATVATSGDYDDLTNKPTIPTVPTNVSAFTNDAGYITGITSSMVTTALGYTPGTSNFDGAYNSLTGKPDLSVYAESADLATVATSGSYTDLTDKPTIPTVNDNTITITQGGVTKGSFTLNQNTNQTIDVDDVPGMVGEVLFDNASGSTDLTLTMAHSFADYSYIDIQWANNDGVTNSTRIYEPNGKRISVINMYGWNPGTPEYINKAGIYDLSGTSMTQVCKIQGTIRNNTNSGVDYKSDSTVDGLIKITKVVGYKQNNAPIVIPYIPDICYHNGDKYINNSNYYNVTGYLTGSGKQIQLQITTAKSLANITSITVNKFAPVLRGVAGYVNGNSYLDYVTTAGYTVTANKASDNSFNVIIMATNAYSGGNNNTPINAVFNTSGLEVTFNE